jgi:NADH:ubiquinone oxidoreductase subunit 4 (subunit M)
VYLLWSYQRVFFGSITQDKNGTLPDADPRERGILFLMAAVILWMGIGSPFFTRRMETSTQNVLQLMQRPGAYDVGGRNDMDHPPIPPSGAIAAASGGVGSWVNSK